MQRDSREVSTSHMNDNRTKVEAGSLTKPGLLVVFTTVLVTTPQFSFLLVFTVSRHIVLSQQHGLLHGKRLLCVPVVWSSKQLRKLLP